MSAITVLHFNCVFMSMQDEIRGAAGVQRPASYRKQGEQITVGAYE